MEKWVVAAKKADFQAIAKKFNINQVTARLLRNRDVIGDEAIEEYLNGSLLYLNDGLKMKDMGKAVQILKQKIAEQKKIRIIGDYDIDGVCSTYILYKGLRRLGADVDYEIPHRMTDGYGINENLILAAAQDNVDTILTCDNGIAAVPQIYYAKKNGMTVVITDHHEPMEELPDADAIVNPHQKDCPYPFKELCGAAVAWKLICCLYDEMRLSKEEAERFIEFVAIATVGDVVSLTGENRILVREGLMQIANTSNQGLKALTEVNGLEPENINSYHIGFVIGPCINASGRLDTAKKALELFLSKSEKDAVRLAVELKTLNDERKDMTQQYSEMAVKIAEGQEYAEDRVLVIYLPECHESLAGIIAGRLREYFYKPSFVLTDGETGVKGSGRSIEGYHMFEELVKCQTLLTKFGGHPMAAGISLEKAQVENFRRRINELCTLTAEDMVPKITIDVPMPIDYITEELVEEFECLEPFGKDNPKPLFAEKNLNVLNARILGKNRNVVKMQMLNPTGAVMDALYFGDVEGLQNYIEEKYGAKEKEKLFQNRANKVSLSVTYYPTINKFRDLKTLQIVVQQYQ